MFYLVVFSLEILFRERRKNGTQFFFLNLASPLPKNLEGFLELLIEITYKKSTYDARLGEISGDSYGKSYSFS